MFDVKPRVGGQSWHSFQFLRLRPLNIAAVATEPRWSLQTSLWRSCHPLARDVRWGSKEHWRLVFISVGVSDLKDTCTRLHHPAPNTNLISHAGAVAADDDGGGDDDGDGEYVTMTIDNRYDLTTLSGSDSRSV